MLDVVKDLTPTAATISMHGLGFLQVKLPANRRIHVWHPELPRRACFDHSAVHNHRFGFRSTILIGRQFNQRVDLVFHPEGTHDVVSHDGPRSEKGGRLSYVAGRVNLRYREMEDYAPGQSYTMPRFEYHHTPNSGIVVTLMEKLEEDREIHACSIVARPHVFDQDFDRFQLSEGEMWEFVTDAFKDGDNGGLIER